jgi:hypothetical protein
MERLNNFAVFVSSFEMIPKYEDPHSICILILKLNKTKSINEKIK